MLRRLPHLLAGTIVNKNPSSSSASSAKKILSNKTTSTESVADSMWSLFNQKQTETKEKISKASSMLEEADFIDTKSVFDHDTCSSSSCDGHHHHHHHKKDDDTNILLSTTSQEERLKNFGMFGYAAPLPNNNNNNNNNNKNNNNESNTNSDDNTFAKEIPAIFKQSWTDFFVSEVPAGMKKPVSREYDLSIPEFPPWLLREMSVQEIIGALEEKEKGSQALRLAEDDEEKGEENASENADGGEEEKKKDQPQELELVLENPDGNVITSTESLFKSPEEIELEIVRKEKQAQKMLQDAYDKLEQVGVTKTFVKSEKSKKRDFYLQCVLHKQAVPDAKARSWLSRALRVHPSDISVSGIKDFKGDTVQFIRLKNVSPQAAIRANYWIRRQMMKEKKRLSEMRQTSKFLFSPRFSSFHKELQPEDTAPLRPEQLLDEDSIFSNMKRGRQAAEREREERENDKIAVVNKNISVYYNKDQQYRNGKIVSDHHLKPFRISEAVGDDQKGAGGEDNNNQDNKKQDASEDPSTVGRVTFPAPTPYPKESQAPLMMMSHFSYHEKPLIAGNLEGNHFRIILRDVPADIPDERFQFAADNLVKHGFPNFFGCQRFSWFGPIDRDPAFALLNGDVGNFAFRMLDFTECDHTLRELLQRPLLYPTEFQEAFRRRVVKNLDDAGVQPNDLDNTEYFLSCPLIGETTEVLFSKGIELDKVRNTAQDTQLVVKIVYAMLDALQALDGTARRLVAQSLCSFFWNLCLSERIRRFGLQKLLPGDFILDPRVRKLRETVTGKNFGRVDFVKKYGAQIYDANDLSQYSMFDVFHPCFEFHNTKILAPEPIQKIMHEICDEYGLHWAARGPQRLGIRRDFSDAPRAICAKVSNFNWSRRKEDPSIVEVEFTLGKGSYANVALREFLRTAVACPGAEEVTVKPLPAAAWEVGRKDPGAMRMSAEDLYPSWIPEDGPEDVPDDKAEPIDIFSFEGAWTRRDEKYDIMKWNRHVLPRNMERRIRQNKIRARMLFEPVLGDHLSEHEVMRYAGHSVPLGPNAPRKKIARKVYQTRMKHERDPQKRRLLTELSRKSDRADEYMRASRTFTWTPQR